MYIYIMNQAKPSLQFLVFYKKGWLCFTSNRQLGHLKTAPPFTVPCEGREAR